jgi:hypothetical protein
MRLMPCRQRARVAAFAAWCRRFSAARTAARPVLVDGVPRRQLLQQRLSRPRAQPAAGRRDGRCGAHWAQWLRSLAPRHRPRAPSTMRSSASLPSSPAARPRCCSPPATWRTWACQRAGRARRDLVQDEAQPRLADRWRAVVAMRRCSAIATPMRTRPGAWPTPPKRQAGALSLPMACSAWMATSRRCASWRSRARAPGLAGGR